MKRNCQWCGILFFLAILPEFIVSRVFDQIPLKSPTEEVDQAYVFPLPYGNYTGKYDAVNDVVVFRNIRYAAPPTGRARWFMPLPPSAGMPLQGGTCHQACPDWFCPKGKGDPKMPTFPHPGVPSDNPQQEDCLFLDVIVPGIVFRNKTLPALSVVVWIHGGGYIEGSKDLYDGTGLVTLSGHTIIFVAINYRLGAFGFLAGPDVENGKRYPNVAFYDQLFALLWTRRYIQGVNGNPKDITVMGESAGAGSIEHHLTNPNYTPLFQKAIIQSPAFVPQYDPNYLQTQFKTFAKNAGCGDAGLDCLWGQPELVLAKANNLSVNPAPFGQSVFGPAVDGFFVKNLPGVRFKNGSFWKDIKVLLGHTSNEGYVFSPKISKPADFDAWVSSSFPNVPAQFPKAVDGFYPPSPQPGRYRDESQRLDQLISEAAVNCNIFYMSNAYGVDNTFNYYFGSLAGYHGFDLCWTFEKFVLLYKGLNICPEIRGLSKRPQYFRQYLLSFITTSNPNFAGEPTLWTPFGPNKSALYMDITKMGMITDDKVPSDRCGFWQPAPYCKTC